MTTRAERKTGGYCQTSMLARVKELNRDGFRLWVFKRNTAARRFYERHGLRLVKLADKSENEECDPDALYQWRP